MLSNAALAVAIESLNGTESGNEKTDDAKLQARQHNYFKFLLWATFGLAAIRFTGVRVMTGLRQVKQLTDIDVSFRLHSSCTSSAGGISSGGAVGVRYTYIVVIQYCPTAYAVDDERDEPFCLFFPFKFALMPTTRTIYHSLLARVICI